MHTQTLDLWETYFKKKDETLGFCSLLIFNIVDYLISRQRQEKDIELPKDYVVT